MKFYYVDPPSFEGNAEGEDHREWFTSRADADRCFNDWVRRIKRWDRESDQPGWDGHHEDDFNCALVMMGAVDIVPTKRGILEALNNRCRGDRLATYPDPK